MPALPNPRGPISAAALELIAGRDEGADRAPEDVRDPLADDDFQLALYCLYELHYRGFDGVDPQREWDPGVLAFRARLESAFSAALDDLLAPAAAEAGPIDVALRAIADGDDGPSLSRHLELRGSEWQMREFLAHRSAYQLKEADPHSWAIPRLSGRAKAALVEIQADEYGGGRPERIHAALFGDSMRALGLSSEYGAYLGLLPGVTLATVNLMSLFGLHRGLRGAIVGHLALFEMSSTLPNRRYGNALRRLGFDSVEAVEFFDEHVEADAVHENLAAVDLAGGLVEQEPELREQVIFGARALVALDRRWADHVLGRWRAGESSLLGPLALAGGLEADSPVRAVAERA